MKIEELTNEELAELERKARNEYQRQWRLKNKDKVRASQKRWIEKNEEKHKEQQRKYWAKKALEMGL